MRIDRECLACGQAARCVEVADCSNRRLLRTGETLYESGDPGGGVWQVLDGFVALRAYTEAGERVMVRLVGRGGVFGYRSSVAGDAHMTSAQAICDSRVKHIPGALLERMIAREPRLGAALLRALAVSLREAGERIVLLATQNARAKLLTFCAELARAQGEPLRPEGFRVALPMTLQDFSELAGIRPETLSRTLRRLEDDGMLARSGGNVLEIGAGWDTHTREG